MLNRFTLMFIVVTVANFRSLVFPCPRPMFGRGAGGGIGKSFDARQKIGVNDVRQRLGGGGAGKDCHYPLDKLNAKSLLSDI